MQDQSSRPAEDILVMSSVNVVYANIILALRGISLSVPKGGMVALLGANGAGKTTTLKAISNLLSLERGQVKTGSIVYEGSEIQGLAPECLVKRGIVQVLEGRRCFLNLTVEENLSTALNNAGGQNRTPFDRLEEIYGYFPKLFDHRKNKAGLMSGGEQQMLAIGRALLAQPKLLLLDEPSMGLAPKIVDQIFEILHTLNQSLGLSILVAEQNIRVALRHADFGYVLNNGMVSRSGPAAELSRSEDVTASYLGGAHGGQDTLIRRFRPKAGVVDWMT